MTSYILGDIAGPLIAPPISRIDTESGAAGLHRNENEYLVEDAGIVSDELMSNAHGIFKPELRRFNWRIVPERFIVVDKQIEFIH